MTNNIDQEIVQFVLNEPKSVNFGAIIKHFNLDPSLFMESVERLKSRREIRISFGVGGLGYECGPQGSIAKMI